MSDTRSNIAIVTGANRGIGLACSKYLAKWGYEVILAARDRSEGLRAVKELDKIGYMVKFAKLDVTNQRIIDKLMEGLTRIGEIINYANIYIKDGLDYYEITENDLKKTLDVNTLGAWKMCKAVAPLMINTKLGRIVNVSSGWGSLNDMKKNAPAYRIFKAALNALTLIVSDELADKRDIKVNAVCPGWVKTRMGCENAEIEVENAALDVLWRTTFGEKGSTGMFYRQREALIW